jgi:hypothetical protein
MVSTGIVVVGGSHGVQVFVMTPPIITPTNKFSIGN